MNTARSEHTIAANTILITFSRYLSGFPCYQSILCELTCGVGSFLTNTPHGLNITEFIRRTKDRAQTINAFRTTFVLEDFHDRLTF